MPEQRPSIIFRLDSGSDRAPFRQLVDQVVDAFERGQLRVGDQLPSVREVVRQITINPNTVHRAYRELEHRGFVEGRLGLGTFIVESNIAAPVEYRSQSWRALFREGVELAKSIDVDAESIVDYLHTLLSSDAEVRP